MFYHEGDNCGHSDTSLRRRELVQRNSYAQWDGIILICKHTVILQFPILAYPTFLYNLFIIFLRHYDNVLENTYI